MGSPPLRMSTPPHWFSLITFSGITMYFYVRKGKFVAHHWGTHALWETLTYTPVIIPLPFSFIAIPAAWPWKMWFPLWERKQILNKLILCNFTKIQGDDTQPVVSSLISIIYALCWEKKQASFMRNNFLWTVFSHLFLSWKTIVFTFISWICQQIVKHKILLKIIVGDGGLYIVGKDAVILNTNDYQGKVSSGYKKMVIECL